MNSRQFLLKFVVWNMRWMTRYLGFLARPIISWMADREVIACGFRHGDVIRVGANTARGVSVDSPRISVKESTIFDPELLSARILPGGGIRFIWEKGREANAMIHFLVLEDSQGNCPAAIYTRELSWSYPLTQRASLSLGPDEPPGLRESESYTAKLVFVDFDGWVSAIAQRSFIYRTAGLKVEPYSED